MMCVIIFSDDDSDEADEEEEEYTVGTVEEIDDEDEEPKRTLIDLDPAEREQELELQRRQMNDIMDLLRDNCPESNSEEDIQEQLRLYV